MCYIIIMLWDFLTGNNKNNNKEKNIKYVFNPDSNDFITSTLSDGNGNINLFRMIIDPKAPDLTQRIYTNARSSY